MFGFELIIAGLVWGLPAAIVNALSPTAMVAALGPIISAAILMGILK